MDELKVKVAVLETQVGEVQSDVKEIKDDVKGLRDAFFESTRGLTRSEKIAVWSVVFAGVGSVVAVVVMLVGPNAVFGLIS